MNQDYIVKILNKFDEQFGKQDPEDESASIGRWAGCDNCFGNIKERIEHKDFLQQALTDQRNLLIEDFKKCVPSRIDPKLDNIIKEEVAGFNICRNQILDNIEKL